MNADFLVLSRSTFSGDLTLEQIEALQASAASFLRAGGVLSWQEWTGLSDVSREAFEKAGAVVWSERCAAIACYLADPVEAVRVVKGEDVAVETALRAVEDPK